jgi:SAM-dependent methyltransferase
MIARAQANADRPGNRDQRRPTFLVGDVAALAFLNGSFDLVVSTLSMHHWADPTAGLAEIGRVLRPDARALIWDFRPGVRPHLFGPRHAHLPDPVEHSRLPASSSERHALALALAVHPHPANRAPRCPCRRPRSHWHRDSLAPAPPPSRSPRRPIDEDILPALDLCRADQREGVLRTLGTRSGLLEGHVRRHGRERTVRGHRQVLGMGAP